MEVLHHPLKVAHVRNVAFDILARHHYGDQLGGRDAEKFRDPFDPPELKSAKTDRYFGVAEIFAKISWSLSRARPLGNRCSCSHFWSVLKLIPHSFAAWPWVNPAAIRAARICFASVMIFGRVVLIRFFHWSFDGLSESRAVDVSASAAHIFCSGYASSATLGAVVSRIILEIQSLPTVSARLGKLNGAGQWNRGGRGDRGEDS